MAKRPVFRNRTTAENMAQTHGGTVRRWDNERGIIPRQILTPKAHGWNIHGYVVLTEDDSQS